MNQQYSERMGRHMALLRRQKKLTQEQLAARLQVQPDFICNSVIQLKMKIHSGNIQRSVC